MDASGIGGADRQCDQGHRGQHGNRHCAARVLGGPQDFGQMQPGDVLVASITTPAWTSLFAMASGVVTDIGGPLSHSSIVAREYGIPAVLGTAVATRLIHSGQLITVDGDAGVVRLLDGQEPSEIEPDEELTAPQDHRWRRRRSGRGWADRVVDPTPRQKLAEKDHSLLGSTSSAMRLPISNEAVAAGDGAFSTWT